MSRAILTVTLVTLLAAASGPPGTAADRPMWAYPASSAPASRSCTACHLTNGFGRPESASLAGLPAVYIAEQIADYRKGVRRSAEPGMGPGATMAAVALAADESEVVKSIERFASLTYTPWIQVIESDLVPVAAIADGLLVSPGSGAEPIGDRIVEVAGARARPRDDVRGFVAYVPAGSLRRGEALVTRGGSGRTVRCGLCHGEDLKGLGPVPGLAGRSPSYQFRQLYDMQHGARRGLGSDLMRATVARLGTADMIAIAAYTASRHP